MHSILTLSQLLSKCTAICSLKNIYPTSTSVVAGFYIFNSTLNKAPIYYKAYNYVQIPLDFASDINTSTLSEISLLSALPRTRLL